MSIWRYELQSDHWDYEVPEIKDLMAQAGISEELQDQFFALLPGGILRVNRGYAWDGCSIVGDGPRVEPPEGFVVKCSDPTDGYRQTTAASMPHDVLYQFWAKIILWLRAHVPEKDRDKLTWSWIKAAADKLFQKELKKAGFEYWLAYYIGVRTLGNAYKGIKWAWRKIKDLF